MLHGAPSPAGRGQRRSDPRRCGGHRRLRELPDRRPHHHDEHPRGHGLRRAGAGARSGAAQRVVRRADPDAITALARIISKLHDDDGNVAIPGLRRSPGRAPPTRRGTSARRPERSPGCGSREAARSRTACGPARPWRCSASMPRPSTARRTRSCRWRAHGSASGSRPGDDAVAATEKLIAFLGDAAPWGGRGDGRGRGVRGRAGLHRRHGGACARRARDALHEAYGADVMETGSGGSIPLVPMLAGPSPASLC